MIDPVELAEYSPARKAGAVLRYSRADMGGDDVVFVVLEDRVEKDYSEPGTLCLIIQGELWGNGPGELLHIRGIVDASEEEKL